MKHEFGFGKVHSSCFSVPAQSHKNKAERKPERVRDAVIDLVYHGNWELQALSYISLC